MKGLLYGMMGLCWLGLAWTSPARAESFPLPASNSVAEIEGPLDFSTAVALALRQSPALRNGLIQLEVRHLDKRDARARYLPSIYVHADYLIDAPDTVTEPFSLQVTTGNYDPLGAYFTTQAQQELVRLAELTYLQAIADGLRQAGEIFLTLAALEEAQTIQSEQMEWAGRNVAWWTNRMDQFGAPLEVQVAEQERIGIRLEGEKLVIRQRQAKRDLAALLGLDADAPLPEVQAATAREQVLGGVSDSTPDRERAESRALDLRLLEIRFRLQKLGVKGAYAEYLPHPTFGVRSSDPLSNTGLDGLYLFAGVSVPIWEVGRRRRNIRRQKAILEQREMEQESGEETWRRRWIQACDHRELAEAEAEQAAQRVRLAELNLTRQELAVSSGREEWPALKKAQYHLATVRLQAVEKSLALDRANLAFRHLGRDLLDRYVRVDGLLDRPLAAWSDIGVSHPEK